MEKRKKIDIRPITKENEAVLALPNEPFKNEGRIIPIYDGEQWSYRTELFDASHITEECFPDEHYQLSSMGEGFHGFAAYVDGECAGFALVYKQWNHYLYIDNLLVLKRFRRLGVGTALIDAAMQLVKEMGELGVWLVCQDNNLQAMRFYLHNEFTLGGMNLPVYDGTKQAGKSDLYLYKRVADDA